MSGVAGGTRIKKADVKRTFEQYKRDILEEVPGYKASSLSGSVKVGSKSDYGDLDLIVYIEAEDKREAKKRIIDVVTKASDKLIIPFKSEKYEGRKYYNSGEMISILYPIQGAEGEIQVDNIIALTEKEQTFKNNFLDLPAERQGLIIGLAKVILLEEDKEAVFDRLGIKVEEGLEDNQEYEFNLSSSKLSLRKVTLEGYKEVKREEVWSTADWTKIEELYKNFNIDGTFEELLTDIKRKLKNPRSKRRVKGIFNSMVSVKSGEKGKPKGDNKERALKKVNTILEDKSKQILSMYAGGFKPPHRAHFENAKLLQQKSDKLRIYIGAKVRGGIRVTGAQSKRIWEIYSKYLNKPTEIEIAKVTPIKSIYDFVDANKGNYKKIITGTLQEEMKKFAYFEKHKDKYPEVEVVSLPKIGDEEEKVSASTLRQSVEYLKEGGWIPTELSKEDREKVLEIAIENVPTEEEIALQEVLENTLEKWINGETGKKPIKEQLDKVSSNLTSTERADLSNLYFRLNNLISTELFTIDFNDDRIVIQRKLKNEPQFRYTEHIASLLQYMEEKGANIRPLPEVKVRRDIEESANIFGKTAYYTPDNKEIVLYVHNRHPKDVLRSFSHEMIHHIQNIEGRINGIDGTDVNESENLQKLEEEAYLRGNMLFRGWEDELKNS